MNTTAQRQLSNQRRTIEVLNNALSSIEFYKKLIEESLGIIKDFKTSNQVTGELSDIDSNYLWRAYCMSNEFNDQEEDFGTTKLSIFFPLEDFNRDYKDNPLRQKYTPEDTEDDGEHGYEDNQ